MSPDNRPCYYRNGNEAKTNAPCTSENHTSCCDSKDICLTNGLCVNIGHQPYVLSRGSCTNPAWDEGCPQYCTDVNPTGGSSMINLDYRGGVATYCCGTPVSNGSNVVCPDGSDGFRIPSGDAIHGRALMTNVSFTSPTPSPSADASASCHQTAIGAGVGVPLGLIALATTAWAVFERRRRRPQSPSEVQPQVIHVPTPVVMDNGFYGETHKPPVELPHGQPVAEIMSRER
ncbi:hypothetical protein FE257_000892 [Aspergillus nanangensis]|uniref:Uncharacterized protein n=1 Tax=Aspergillus nanangensis TaxID=2582783 RepID=A0AAD4GPY9_ASPNN|nr:hypothetical protein FE257_000892 [Aspergillus nanangensis]